MRDCPPPSVHYRVLGHHTLAGEAMVRPWWRSRPRCSFSRMEVTFRWLSAIDEAGLITDVTVNFQGRAKAERLLAAP